MFTRSEIELSPKLDAREIENIVAKIVPQIAEEKDFEFFTGLITIKLEACEDCTQAAAFISSLLS